MGDGALEQVIQRNSGVFLLGDLQKLSGRGVALKGKEVWQALSSIVFHLDLRYQRGWGRLILSDTNSALKSSRIQYVELP